MADTPCPTSQPTDPPAHRIAQAKHFDVRVTVTRIGGRLDAVLPKICRPRKGAPERRTELVDLPEPVIKTFLAMDQQVVSWLRQSPENVEAFIADPMAALKSAPLHIPRAELKAIERLRARVGSTQIVPPNVLMRSLKAQASDEARPRRDQQDCNCGPTGKRRR